MQARNDRREFLQLSLAAGALLSAGARARGQEREAGSGRAEQPLKLLVLGGTRFLGPAIVDAALARGHAVTLFNRGRTNPELYPELEQLRGDRDPGKDEGLAALEGRKFDAVLDDSGYYPRHVAASAGVLAKSGCGHYVFVSSISACAENDVEDADETAAVATMTDPALEELGASYENYGALKALCETAAESAFPGRCTNIRPGYIVGPLDPSDRFTYWPVRIRRGGTVLVPGEPQDPIQVIDVRDLGTWMVRVAERRAAGVFNACGPAKPLAWGELLRTCREVGKPRDLTLRWAAVEQLEALGALPFPIWAPHAGPTKGFHTWSNARATAAGLTFRPLVETVRDTLAWFDSLPEERREQLRAGLSEEQEREALAKLAR